MFDIQSQGLLAKCVFGDHFRMSIQIKLVVFVTKIHAKRSSQRVVETSSNFLFLDGIDY